MLRPGLLRSVATSTGRRVIGAAVAAAAGAIVASIVTLNGVASTSANSHLYQLSPGNGATVVAGSATTFTWHSGFSNAAAVSYLTVYLAGPDGTVRTQFNCAPSCTPSCRTLWTSPPLAAGQTMR